MSWTTTKIKELYERIKTTWRWDGHYTGVFVDGQEYRTSNPEDIPAEGLIGIYNGAVEFNHLQEDLQQ